MTYIPTCLPAPRKAKNGARFGRLTIVDDAPVGAPPGACLVKCDCGGPDDPRQHAYGYEGTGYLWGNIRNLQHYLTLSCGCLKRMNRVRPGDRFGSLTYVENTKGRMGVGTWRCDCGKTCYAMLRFVRTGMVRSCPECAPETRKKATGTSIWEHVYFDGMSIHDHMRKLDLATPAETLKHLSKELKENA